MLQESNRIEFKAELNDKLEKEIGAFLNNKEGGVLYIGVDDNGNPVGMPNIDSMQLKIADRIKNNILPSTLGLFDMSPNGCFTRVGTSSQPMSTARSDEFYRKQIHNTRIGTE